VRDREREKGRPDTVHYKVSTVPLCARRARCKTQFERFWILLYVLYQSCTFIDKWFRGAGGWCAPFVNRNNIHVVHPLPRRSGSQEMHFSPCRFLYFQSSAPARSVFFDNIICRFSLRRQLFVDYITREYNIIPFFIFIFLLYPRWT
jgi:hypothetical protein